MSEAEIIALLSAIGSIDWIDVMIHTQHELPSMSDERNKSGDLVLCGGGDNTVVWFPIN